MILFGVNWLALSGIVNERHNLINPYFIKKFVKITFATIGMIALVCYWDESFQTLRDIGYIPADFYDTYKDMMKEYNDETLMAESDFWKWLSNLCLGTILVWFSIFLCIQSWIIKTVNLQKHYIMVKHAWK